MKLMMIGTTALLLMLLTACSNDFDSRAEGKWQLLQTERQGVTETVDTVFYNFQNALFMLQVYHPDVDTFSHCYGYKTTGPGQQLFLELTDYPMPVTRFLPQTDWRSAQRAFAIESIAGNRLVLSADSIRYIFHRF